jgi:hypothetical protein
MPNKKEERNKPEKQKSSQKNHKHWKVSKLNYSTNKDSNKKYKWKRLSKNINKKMLKAESKILKMVLFPHI